MKEQNDIDSIFREGLYNRHVNYDPSAWNDAEKMIIDQEKKRFSLYRYRYYLSTLVIGIASSFIFLANDFKKEGIHNRDIAQLNSESQLQANSKTTNISTKETNESVSIRNGFVFNTPKGQKTSSNPIKKSDNPRFNKDVAFVNKTNRPKQSKNSLVQKTNPNIPPTSSATFDFKNTNANLYDQDRFKASDGDDFRNLNLTMMESRSVSNEESGEGIIDPRHDPMANYTPFRKLNSVKILAGLALFTNTDIETNKKSIDEGIILGIGYEKYLGNKISLEGDVIFSNRNALNASVSSRQIQYNFGFYLYERELKFQENQYLDFPILVHFNLNYLHQISLGLQYSTLLRTKVQTTTTTASSLEDISTSQEIQWVKTDYFSQSDFSIQVGYSYSITEKLSAGLRFQLGLSDMSTEKLSEASHKNDQVRFLIQYSPWK